MAAAGFGLGLALRRRELLVPLVAAAAAHDAQPLPEDPPSLRKRLEARHIQHVQHVQPVQQQSTMQVVCPQGAGPGTMIQIADQFGRLIQVQVPNGIYPGQSFVVAVSQQPVIQQAVPMY